MSDTQAFNKENVEAKMQKIGGYFDEVGLAYSTADSEMANKLTTHNGAMFGDGATKLLAAWDENSGTLEDFMKTFENWSALVSGMAQKFTSFESGTYEIKDASKKEDLISKAKAFHTTALKTEKGIEGFNLAQKEMHNSPDKSYDENGVEYRSYKGLENGKIVETRVYGDSGDLYVVEEHWEWDESQGKFVNKPKYYNAKTYETNADSVRPTFAGVKELTEDEFKNIYNKTNKDTMIEHYRNKYLGEYLNGEINKDDIPEEIRDEVLASLEKIGNGAKYEYDDQGRVVKVSIGTDRSIVYIYDSDGNLIETEYYVGNDKIDSAETFFEQFKAASDEQTTTEGEGASGGESVTSEPENHSAKYKPDGSEESYELMLGEDGNTYLSFDNGTMYRVETNQDGTRTFYKSNENNNEYTLADPEKIQELNNVMDGFANGDDYAKALAGATEGSITYSLASDGNIIKTKTDDKGNYIKVFYNENGDIIRAESYDKNGNSTGPLTITDEEINQIIKEDNNTSLNNSSKNGLTITINNEEENKNIS